MKNLENYGVLEMDAREIRETDGGVIGCLAVFAIVALVGLAGVAVGYGIAKAID